MNGLFNFLKKLILAIINIITSSDTYRVTLRVLWLFFPSLVFLFLCWFAFWNISQGRDLMVYTLEQPPVYICFVIAIIFFSFIQWYSSRLVMKAKFWQDNEYLPLLLRVHLPRFFGYTCYTITILAFLQLGISESPHLSRSIACLFFLFSILYYYLLDRLFNFLVFIKNYPGKIFLIIIILLIGLCSVTIMAFEHFRFAGLVSVLAVLQISTVLFYIIRRRIIQNDPKVKNFKPKDFSDKTWLGFIGANLRQLFKDPEEKGSIRVFNIVAIIAFIIYVVTIASIDFSVFIGTFPFIFLAFGVMAGFINFVSTVSVFCRFNFHIFFFVLAFIAVKHEPHKVYLVSKQNPQANYKSRQRLKEYFTNWIKARFPDSTSLQSQQPVYFILADGGASRSGYWVASVLGRIQDSVGEKFSNNIFCLSGASGGSVGNAAYYMLLRNKKMVAEKQLTYRESSKDYLKSDFLSYTIARMLGPDFFRYALPFVLNGVNDRAYALTAALEKAGCDTSFLFNAFATGMSSLITQTNQPADMPILCINTTRMQDGRPGVISTIDMNESFFNRRIDILSLLDEKKDLKLSSAIVLGASFPYICPAGRIDTRARKEGGDSISIPHYFVDGGYFDNSGAGVVTEMIIALKQLMVQDSFLKGFTNKLDFHVLHITNDPHPDGEPILGKVNPIVNDLAAPLQTLAGAYGSQTSVNDSRLKNYILNNIGSNNYHRLNLYQENDKLGFSMSWVISKRARDSMDYRVNTSGSVKVLLPQIKNGF
jgi:predicted acylesterase/phospholipase RssA